MLRKGIKIRETLFTLPSPLVHLFFYHLVNIALAGSSGGRGGRLTLI